MSSLAECRDHCIEFLRYSLPLVARVADSLPSLPVFRAEPTEKRAKYRFVEERTPNWWQIPQQLSETLLDSQEGKALSATLEATVPFSAVIGKWIAIQELGRCVRYASGKEIAKEILVSYLFSSGLERWIARNFERVWRDLLDYFEPTTDSLEFYLYAPIAYMGGVSRIINLGDGLKIQRVQAHRVARLASLNPVLAGVTLHHRFTVWPVHFFVKQFHDVNEVHRLIYQTAQYYRRILGTIIDRGQLEINWASRGL